MIFDRLTNLAELMDVELGFQRKQLHEKTAVLKATVMNAVRLALDNGNYSAIATVPEMQELSQYELTAKSLGELNAQLSDMRGTLSGENAAHLLAISTLAKARAASPADSQASALANIGENAATRRRKDAAVKQVEAAEKAGEMRLNLETRPSQLRFESDNPAIPPDAIVCRPNKTQQVRAALRDYLTTDDFMEIDWPKFSDKYGIETKFGQTICSQLAAKGQLLSVKQPHNRVAYALVERNEA